MKTTESSLFDLSTAQDEAVQDLRTLLKFNTVNPPGNEALAIDYIRKRLDEHKIEHVTVDSEGRPNLIARIKGTSETEGALLLTGHVDVVPVEIDHWDADPFAAEIRDNYLFGRGAIDMKNMIAMCLQVMILAKNSDKKPHRDLIFAAVSDEEQGCQHGSKFLVDKHPELVNADYMIGEVGGFNLDINDVRYYPIQVAERGTARLKITATGQPGHGSVPHGNMAVISLAKALDNLSQHRLPQHPCRTVKAFIAELAAAQPAPARWVLPLLLNPILSPLVLNFLLPDKGTAETFSANLSNTVTPTVLEAGDSINVIPGEASAYLDGRLLPGQKAEDLIREIRPYLGENVSIELLSWHPGRENPPGDDPLYRAICSNIMKHDPEGIPIPYMVPGFTDAGYFGELGMRCFGYTPIRFPREDNIQFKALFHGHNERIHIEGFRWGVACLWDLVSGFSGIRLDPYNSPQTAAGFSQQSTEEESTSLQGDQ
jgi:acetylornithine deacetylase/succinyl-diaminopimelate desuccinylase-like protein